MPQPELAAACWTSSAGCTGRLPRRWKNYKMQQIGLSAPKGGTRARARGFSLSPRRSIAAEAQQKGSSGPPSVHPLKQPLDLWRAPQEAVRTKAVRRLSGLHDLAGCGRWTLMRLASTCLCCTRTATTCCMCSRNMCMSRGRAALGRHSTRSSLFCLEQGTSCTRHYW